MLRTVSIIPGMENFAPDRTLHQQRVVPVAELPAERVLQPTQRHRHLHP